MACQLLPHFKQNNNMSVLSPFYRYIFSSKTRKESGSKITYVVGWKGIGQKRRNWIFKVDLLILTICHLC